MAHAKATVQPRASLKEKLSALKRNSDGTAWVQDYYNEKYRIICDFILSLTEFCLKHTYGHKNR